MTGRYAFLLSRRWLGFAALALVVSIACVFLGRWQLHRYDAKDHRAELVRQNYDAAPAALTDLVPSPDSSWPESRTWRPVELEGEYLEPALTLPKRPIEGSPADHVIAVFAADVDGQDWLVVVDRGWYPTDSFVDHAPQHELPSGQVSLTTHLVAAEPPSDRELSPGNLHHLNPEQVVAELTSVNPDLDLAGVPVVTGAYGILAQEHPTTAEPPTPLPRPSTDLGNHLSYTFQWWVFGIGAWVAYGVMARREAIDRAEEPHPQAPSPRPEERQRPAAAHPGGPAARKRRRITLADDAEEDALIDAQLGRPDPSPHTTAEQTGSAQANDTNST